MKVKKLAVGLMALLVAFSATACGGSSSSSGAKVPIKIVNYGGGIGSVWLDEAIARFEEQVKDKTYGEMKGADIDYVATMTMDLDSISTSANHIYFTQGTSNIRTMIQNGYLMDISDVVTETGADGKTVLSKIDDSYEVMLKGPQDKYYALPHYEFYSGLSYDIELFEEMGYYFAAPTETDVMTFNSAKGFGSAKFVASADAVKSCGPNGISGDYDDGLPSSVQELLILCERMKGEIDAPILYTGGNEAYSNMLASSLWTALGGYEEMRAYHDYSGTVTVVDGYEESNLFNSSVPAPKTKSVELTEATGYYVTQQAARYYTLAFLEIAFKEGYIERGSTTYDNVTAQQDFIANGVGANDTVGMLIEGNYWINEADDYELFDKYYAAIKNAKDYRKIGWLPLPAQWSGSVTEGNGSTPTMVDVSASYAFVNNRFSGNQAVVDVCKDFLKFLYTDSELSRFTGVTGVAKAALNYSLDSADQAKLDEFESSVWAMKKTGNVVYATASNATFQGSYNTLRLSGNSPLLRPIFDRQYETSLAAIRVGKTAKEIFEKTALDATDWSEYYKG